MDALPVLALFPWLPLPLSEQERGRGESSRFLFVCGLERPAESRWLRLHTGCERAWMCLRVSMCVCVCACFLSNLGAQFNDPSLYDGH